MSYSLVFSESYSRRARKLLKKHPELRSQYLKTLQLLELDPYHRSLRLHALEGRLAGVHSVSINISYRITLEFLVDDHEIIPVNVGTHDDVYRQ
ncbi:MAG: plasmid stabilization protein [Gammaproteobacteria bacterium]|uniref:Plasmid stabilization protein n=1 Tax=Candidatus Thiopontia autotrophica TaxID=2841688 RepID=A0A8J6P9G7_9GAMM|nr:plasmid stabilization protein [Candidatus Thiopontia autotrophica]MBL6969119.1 plasmid stabilization protein [Gammaproteobacteria bacterium]